MSFWLIKSEEEKYNQKQLNRLRDEYIDIALDLQYPSECIKEIKKAMNESQMCEIMTEFRKRSLVA